MSTEGSGAKAADQGGGVSAQIGLWDGVSIIVGIVVGTSIFKMPPSIFSNVSGPWVGLGAWLLGGALCVVGALCYAELATTYPHAGGDYAWLKRAYGSSSAFLFAWAQLVAVLTGSIGVMAYAFADYATKLTGGSPSQAVGFAIAAVVSLSVVNLLGVVIGKGAQNVLTLAKVLGLLGIVVAGFFWGQGGAFTVEKPMGGPGFGLAMIFILYAYGGWNDAAFVAAEVRDHHRNIPRVLLLGTAGVMGIYLLVNLAYLVGLGFEGLRKAGQAPAADVLARMLGKGGANAMCILVMLSALGAVNGLILTGSRVFAALGADHRVFAMLGRWHPTRGTPVWSLVLQGLVAIVMILAVGTVAGRTAFDSALSSMGLGVVPWEDYYGGFETLVAGTAPVFWLFFLAVGLALFALREKDHGIGRPFTVPCYPLFPFVFCLTCVYMLHSSLTYAGWLSLFGLVPLALGVPLYFASRRLWPGQAASGEAAPRQ